MNQNGYPYFHKHKGDFVPDSPQQELVPQEVFEEIKLTLEQEQWEPVCNFHEDELQNGILLTADLENMKFRIKLQDCTNEEELDCFLSHFNHREPNCGQIHHHFDENTHHSSVEIYSSVKYH